MLREARHAPGFAARSRLRFSFMNSARHVMAERFQSSVAVIPAASRDIDWSLKHRVEINNLMHEIATDESCTAEANQRSRFCRTNYDGLLLQKISSTISSPHSLHLVGILANAVGWDTYQLLGEG